MELRDGRGVKLTGRCFPLSKKVFYLTDIIQQTHHPLGNSWSAREDRNLSYIAMARCDNCPLRNGYNSRVGPWTQNFKGEILMAKVLSVIGSHVKLMAVESVEKN